jgi:hypothetical protein
MVNVVSIFSRARDWRHNPDRNLNSRRFFFLNRLTHFYSLKVVHLRLELSLYETIPIDRTSHTTFCSSGLSAQDCHNQICVKNSNLLKPPSLGSL